MASSSIPNFFAKSRKERLDIVADFADLTSEELQILQESSGGISFDTADKMVENAIGMFSLPIGIATNFKINGRDCLVPMVIEEPSVIAAASKAAKAARPSGGFSVTAQESYSIGQIQVLGAQDSAARKLTESSQEILDLANSKSKTLPAMGKGAKGVSSRYIDTRAGRMLIVELEIDVGDAMGANVTNTMCEAVAPLVERITGGRALLRILSNYSTGRMVRATAVFEKDVVGSRQIIDDMILAFEFANSDVYRAVTHNKGIMNGIVAVANATGQDCRAIEAAANAYAASSGRYRSLSRWNKDVNGNLTGTLELPLSVGTVGGVANVHPAARVCTKILGVSSARELACAMAAVGLAQNYGAMRALTTDGIQKGHMALHARNIAAAAGATAEQAEQIAQKMIKEGDVSAGRARELLGG